MFYNIFLNLYLQFAFLLYLRMDLKKTAISTILILILHAACGFAIGFVRVSNYPKNLYSGGAQNWNVVQDDMGKTYVGNRDGLLIFDGIRWKKNFLSNYTTIRSLLYDRETRRIYAGGTEEFGYFYNDPESGVLRYESLIPAFKGKAPAFTEIWKIYRLGDKIWFQADNHYFSYDGKAIKTFSTDRRISTSSLIGQNILIGLEDGSIMSLDDSGLRLLDNSANFAGKKITAILPYGKYGQLMIATSLDGLYIYNGNSVERFDTPINPFLINNQIFCGNCHDSVYVFGTVNAGAVVTDLNTGKTDYINKETGLQNNTVLAADFDKAGNIWLSLDNGVDYAVYNSSMTNLIGAGNSIGAGYCSALVGNKIFLGTNQGLFSTNFPYSASPSLPLMRQDLHGQVWGLTVIGDNILVSSDAGVYQYTGAGFNHINGIPGTLHISLLPDNPDYALASTYQGFHLLTKENGIWKNSGPVEAEENLNGSFIFGPDGTIWLSHWRKGIYHLKLNLASKSIDVIKLYNSSTGLASDDNNTVANFGGNIIFSTREGFFNPDLKGNGNVTKDHESDKLFSNKKYGALQTLPDGTLAYMDESGIYLASVGGDGQKTCKSLVTGNLDEELIPGYVNIRPISDSEYIVSTQDGFNVISSSDAQTKGWKGSPFISAVYANQDSLVYSSPLANKEKYDLQLPFDLNSVKFEFGYPEFDKSAALEFSSYLENYESEWSPFTKEGSREYTRLNEGDYVMHLRVRDAETGLTKEAAFSLTVTPPWFRSTFAKIIYFLTLLVFFAFLIGAVRKWMEKAQKEAEEGKEKELQELRRLSEQEALVKDYEIASLKTEQLEQDIKHKSQELSSTAMNLIQKNEMLNDIASQLASLQKLVSSDASSRTQIQKNISKLQNSIEKSIKGDNNWDAFNKNFDMVYSDYTKKLSEKHPNLTNSDKRLCCYLRMGLSSKEIAPLINISSKSVEMARYRLRKKINLSPDISLTDYLSDI